MSKKVEKNFIVVFMFFLVTSMVVNFLLIRQFNLNGNIVVADILRSSQMVYPTFCIIASLFFINKIYKIKIIFPKKIFCVFILFVFVMLVLITYALSDTKNLSNLFIYILYISSLILLISIYLENKKEREMYRMNLINIKNFAYYSLGFIVVIAVFMTFQSMILIKLGIYKNEYLLGTVMKGLFMSINVIAFLLQIILYMGEEIAWRGFLQPIFQSRFGTIKGLVYVGIIWSLWHTPLSMTIYSPNNFVLELINRTFLCIFLSVLIGYVYMKTCSIFLISFLHFMNNNFSYSFGEYVNQTFTINEVFLSGILATIFIVLIIKTKILHRDFYIEELKIKFQK